MNVPEYGRYEKLLWRFFFDDKEKAGQILLAVTRAETIECYLNLVLDAIPAYDHYYITMDESGPDGLSLFIETFDSETLEEIEQGQAPEDRAMFFVIRDKMEEQLYRICHRK